MKRVITISYTVDNTDAKTIGRLVSPLIFKGLYGLDLSEPRLEVPGGSCSWAADEADTLAAPRARTREHLRHHRLGWRWLLGLRRHFRVGPSGMLPRRGNGSQRPDGHGVCLRACRLAREGGVNASAPLMFTSNHDGRLERLEGEDR